METDENVFLTSEDAKKALRRLKTYGRTNIRYSYIDWFGLDRLISDLREVAGPKANIKISTETFEPSDFIRLVPQDGKEIRVRVPIMPTVVLSLK